MNEVQANLVSDIFKPGWADLFQWALFLQLGRSGWLGRTTEEDAKHHVNCQQKWAEYCESALPHVFPKSKQGE